MIYISVIEKMIMMVILAAKVTAKNLVTLFHFWKFPLTQVTIDTVNYFKALPSLLVVGKPEGMFDMRF